MPSKHAKGKLHLTLNL